MRRALLLLLCLCACAQTLHAQIQVGLTIKRRLHVIYEPIVATVTIVNRSGRDMPLTDADGQHWFGFEITRGDGQIVPPLDPNYQLDPLIIPAGETMKRSVNLNSLFPIHDFGLNRIRATIYFAPLQKYFVSAPVPVEITEGKVMWQQTVGVPDGVKGAGGTRKLSLLTFRQGESKLLYVRVEDVETGAVYCTSPIGRLITGTDPQVEIDFNNQLHVMQVTGPKTWLYTRVGLNGELLGQNVYVSTKTRPTLRRDKTSEVTVAGGQLQDDAAPELGAPSAKGGTVPKLSDRPVDLPKD